MSRFRRPINHGRVIVAGCAFAAFVWAIALSVSPQLHQFVHADANRVEHSCAVTAIASGNCDHAGQPQLISAPDFVSQFGRASLPDSVWAQPLFLKAHLFAHAPPGLG